MIHIISSSRYRVNRQKIKRKVVEMVPNVDIDQSKIVNIVFIGRNKMREIAKTYKHEFVALPVLTFPYNLKQNEKEILIGEVIICYPQAILLAASRNKRVDDIITFLIEHGIKNLLKS